MADSHTRATFQALVDAILPATSKITVPGRNERVTGASDVCLYKFVIQELDHSHKMDIPFSEATAQLLDVAAAELLVKGLAKLPFQGTPFPGGGPFSALLRHDRLRAIDLLDQLNIELHTLPIPYKDNAPLILTMMNSLNQITMFGYYAGWRDYGIEPYSFPQSWIQVGYPGPAFGYRDFRGFVLKFPHKGEKA
ncbi:hypothetical protein [Ammoniphilus sp. YIM 78166]|uniref:hypothetical protein n=1 Tax=Ammoniphilus sp. YIM 78166 TaxID=1644106 RepID=UPI00106FF5EE|nr:hypothetical protein [Ammoniphilus sp. YIM 78166]